MTTADRIAFSPGDRALDGWALADGVAGVVIAPRQAERVGREIGAAFIEVTAGHHRPEARHLYEQLGYDASVSAYLRKKL